MRLARFNIQSASGGDKRYFVGMPSPAAAAIPAATVYAYPVGLLRLPRGAAGAGDGARAGGADGQHDPLPQLQDDRLAERAGRTRCSSSSPAGIVLIATHPQAMLVVMAYSYLASAFIGLAITRFRHRGAASAQAAVEAEQPSAPDQRDTAAGLDLSPSSLGLRPWSVLGPSSSVRSWSEVLRPRRAAAGLWTKD